MISLIVAHDSNRVIGKDNELPWHLPEDLGYFKKMTMGKAMVMGRKTYESIGRPLPGRLSIVVTRNPDYTAEGVVVVNDLKVGIEKAKAYAPEVMIIGGAEIFNMVMEIADRLYITLIQAEFEGDTFFPSYEDEWTLKSTSEEIISKNGTSFVYQIYDKK
jgi:dihydrofolate reductase